MNKIDKKTYRTIFILGLLIYGAGMYLPNFLPISGETAFIVSAVTVAFCVMVLAVRKPY